ncbi:MAG TPA: hypothetical protein VM282_19460 [Acidimicrobiales bacterium]|nr:hypothetical protein [Acidimicrobiales bacterium]
MADGSLPRVAEALAAGKACSTGVSSTGGRFRFRFDGHEGTIALNGLEAVMDRQWRAAHPDRVEENGDRPHYGQRFAAASHHQHDHHHHRSD